MRRVFIVDGARTPFLKVGNQTGPFSAADLAVAAGQPLLQRLHFDPTNFDEVIMGCVIPAPDEANIARSIALRLGCGKKVPAHTVQRNCASGLQAVGTAYDRIKLGASDLILCGGTEAMSRAPIQWNNDMVNWLGQMMKAKTISQRLKVLTKFKLSNLTPVFTLLHGLTDPLSKLGMGQTAEIVAHRFGITREMQDKYAMESHLMLAEAVDSGIFKNEIVPIFDSFGKAYTEDTGLRRDASMKGLAKPRPAFDKKGGTVTAGNSSQITDGAAMLVLASEDALRWYNLQPIAEILGHEWAGVDPDQMGLGPANAIGQLLYEHNLLAKDIDMLEINEAFAAQVLGCLEALKSEEFCRTECPGSIGLPFDFMKDGLVPNRHGGAIALGHPIGASGARIALHLAKNLEKNELGVGSLCIGGGQGGAILLKGVK